MEEWFTNIQKYKISSLKFQKIKSVCLDVRIIFQSYANKTIDVLYLVRTAQFSRRLNNKQIENLQNS